MTLVEGVLAKGVENSEGIGLLAPRPRNHC
jgi:hypothetical protein